MVNSISTTPHTVFKWEKTNPFIPLFPNQCCRFFPIVVLSEGRTGEGNIAWIYREKAATLFGWEIGEYQIFGNAKKISFLDKLLSGVPKLLVGTVYTHLCLELTRAEKYRFNKTLKRYTEERLYHTTPIPQQCNV